MFFAIQSVVARRARRIRRSWIRLNFPGKRWVQMMLRVFQEMGNDQATHLAAGIAYYSMLSLFPLLLGLLSISGSILTYGSLETDFLEFVTDNLPGSSDFVEENVNQVVRFRGLLGVAGVVGLLWSSSTVLGAIARAVNLAWNVPHGRPFYASRLLHIFMAISIGILFLLSAVITSIIELLTRPPSELEIIGLTPLLDLGLGSLALRLIPWSMTLTIFLVIYRFVPDTKTSWRQVWLGALVAAVLFEIGKGIFVWYLENLATYRLIYGSLTSAMALMVWIYVSALVLIMGAEICSEYDRIRMRASERTRSPRVSAADD